MTRKFFLFILFFNLLHFSRAQIVSVMQIDGVINPVTADFIERGLDKAKNDNAECLVLLLNTPGGLLKSTRIIVSKILDAPIPVIVFVYPNGSHAGSAGVFITLAGHIAAMAPGTNIGAAHPVSLQQQMDPVMSEKITNDASAFIKTIAQYRGRDTTWAENAVRHSLAITANEALNQHVIDIIATNLDDLLEKINGKQVALPVGTKILDTKNATREKIEMTIAEKLLNLLAEPNIAYILMMLGMFGILIEFFSPGALFPGIIGGISLILAFYSMNTLPVNYAGLALILFAVILFVLEIKITSHGLLAIGGTISLLLGSLMLFRSDSPFTVNPLSKTIVFTCVAFSALFFLFIATMGLKAQKRKYMVIKDTFQDTIGFAAEEFEKEGMVLVQGELWQAETNAGKIEKGEKIRVLERKNFKLIIEPVKDH